MAEKFVKVANKSGLPQIMLKSNWDNINQNNPKLAEKLEFLHECDEQGNGIGGAEKKAPINQRPFNSNAEKAIVEFEGHLESGSAAANEGNFELAKEHVEKALAMSPNSKVAKQFVDSIQEAIEAKESSTTNNEDNEENNTGSNGNEDERNNGGDSKKSAKVEGDGKGDNSVAGDIKDKLESSKGKKGNKSGDK